MKLGWLSAFAVSVAVVGGAIWLLGPARPSHSVARTTHASVDAKESLLVYGAAGIKPALDPIIQRYGREYGVRIELQIGGSGTLLANLRTVDRGDLYIAGEAGYVEQARQMGLVEEQLAVAVTRPVIAVPTGNPKGITGVESLCLPELRVGLGNPSGPAVGKVSQQLLEKAGIWEEVQENVAQNGVLKPTVSELANDLKLGTIDVAILFDATVHQYPDIEAIPLPEELAIAQRITIGVLKSSHQPTRALHFARYVTAADRGMEDFADQGYSVPQGDVWVDEPEIVLLSGSLLRPAIMRTIREFEEREGAHVLVNYNGCGILVAGLKAGDPADAYFACDTSFIENVSDLFWEPRVVSETAMVIAVPKGNPNGIRSVGDLARPGLKVGVANSQQSALGALTDRLLESMGLLEEVRANVASQVPTADLLVAQLKTGGLDAIICYEVNARQAGPSVERLLIPSSEGIARQPIAVTKRSRHPALVGRLIDRITDATSERRFVESGFEWALPRPSP